MMDFDLIAKTVYAALDDRGCFNHCHDDTCAEILEEIGDIIEAGFATEDA